MDIHSLSDKSMQRVIKQLNSREWWRTAINMEALKSRGTFLASSFQDAEFYGRPLDTPFKVSIENPLFGDECHIMKRLGLTFPDVDMTPQTILQMEATKMHIATCKGFDCIAITTPNQFQRFQRIGHLPLSYELQVFSQASYSQLNVYPEVILNRKT